MESKPRYPLLFNPNARSQKGRRALRFIMSRAQNFILYATRGVDDARELAAKLAADGEPVVIAAGGDGTLNAVVQGLMGTQTALGILPTGTMNVFARELGIPVPNNVVMPLKKALEVIDDGHIKDIDIFLANDRPFIQMAGVGIDAEIIESTSWEMKKALGPLSYLLSAVRILGDNPPKLHVEMDNGSMEEGVAVVAGNGELYGGQFKLFNKADPCDGLLDVVVFKEGGYRIVLDSLRGLAVGDIELSDKTVAYHQVKQMRIRCDEDRPLQVDGELIGRAKEIEFTSKSTKLRVFAPEVPGNNIAEKVMQFMQQANPLLNNQSNTTSNTKKNQDPESAET